LLTGCDSLTFSMYQRTRLGAPIGAYPATSTATAKLIQVQWLCSRQICGVTANTESVQTAKDRHSKKKIYHMKTQPALRTALSGSVLAYTLVATGIISSPCCAT